MNKMKKDELKNILDENDKYVILTNGVISEASFDINSLDIKDNVEFKLIHYIDEDTTFNITINENVKAKIEEIYFLITKDVRIDENIHCMRNSYLDLFSYENTKDCKIRTNVATHLDEGSYINNKTVFLFDKESEVNSNTYLDGKNSMCEAMNVIINSSTKKQNFNYNTFHIAEASTSKMTSYGICKGDSLLNINTNGIIKKDAKATSLWQKSKGLLLDKTSQISANPWLQIDEFDCLASHGASIGAIDDEELYYLMSRGLSKETSERLIVEGFISPCLSQIESKKLSEYLSKVISKKL